jgi:TPR repeat protein
VNLFLSYSRADARIAKRLHSKLTALDYQIWFDERSLTGGDSWKAEIRKGIRASDRVILLFSSKNADRRGFFHAEVKLVLEVLDTVPIEGRYVLPCRLDECSIPSPIAEFQYVDLFPNFESGFKRLLAAIDKSSAAPAGAKPQTTATGLRSALERRAAKGETEAMYRLGQLLALDERAPGHRRAAIRWLERSVAAGHRDAQWLLGSLHAEGPSKKSYLRARAIFLKAAKQNDSDAMNDVGVLYEHGRGVRRDYEKARAYYERSADHGNRDGMFNLGSLLDRGLGDAPDYKTAKVWYERSAALGHASAMFNLGYMYSHGNGVKEDQKKAFYWYRKATAVGDTDAMNNIGSMYQHGRGVRKSYSQACAWYKRAADLGNVRARDNLRRLQAAEKKRLLGQ